MLRVDVACTRGAFALDAALEVPAASRLALAGPSGAGKTTLLRIVAGLLRPERGIVALGETRWADTAAGVHMPPERRRCGYVFQDYALFPHLSVRDNVAYGLRAAPRSARRARADELLERFGVLDLAAARPSSLSGGERQRVALARALAPRPSALLLDEPLAALDARTRAHAARTLDEATRAAGVPTVLVTHDFIDAALLGDEVAVIDGGRVVQRGSAAALAARPASAFVADFTGAVVLTGHACAAPDGLTRVKLDGGGEVVSAERASGRVAVSVYPWEIAVTPQGARDASSAQNHLDVEVVSVTAIGSRVRLGLAAPQPLSAEITDASARRLAIVPGARLTASWKAAATRLVGL
jgi:molybdate transport system ATP-binding protein